ncbi:PREDICTED: epigen isoform X2 [Chinchilla lanigera]|uniref:Epigen n=1 Tax=Chinchilla lanigera TaxID=34839 RepID=A0A8C2V5M6_CHILA|nr:PREDICTED: epigen isoform X2 [Chinchilla lanigera]
MAGGVPMSVYLFFNALAALTAEAGWIGMAPGSAPQSNRTANETRADSVEGPVALKFSHPCLEEHSSYCINGLCAFHRELDQAICRCYTGYTGERCEHLTLTSYAVDSYEKYIAVGIGVGLLLSGFLAIFYCYIRKRCLHLKSPYNMCSGGKQPL